MKQGLILVEGETERLFVVGVLNPHLHARGLHLQARLTHTGKLLGGAIAKGGLSSFAKIEVDLRQIMHSSNDMLVATFLDYYGLPPDFPGMATRPPAVASVRVTHVQDALLRHFGQPANFKPFLMLHEFEAFLLADLDKLAAATRISLSDQATLKRDLARYRSPEEVNDTVEGAPSRRVRRLAARFDKPLHGNLVTNAIGLPRLREACPHFDGFVTSLEAWAAAP